MKRILAITLLLLGVIMGCGQESTAKLTLSSEIRLEKPLFIDGAYFGSGDIELVLEASKDMSILECQRCSHSVTEN